MEIKCKWKNGTDWVDFPTADIMALSRNHTLDLFTRNIPVIIRHGDTIISNDKAVRATYHRNPKYTVIGMDKVERSEETISRVGFV